MEFLIENVVEIINGKEASDSIMESNEVINEEELFSCSNIEIVFVKCSL